MKHNNFENLELVSQISRLVDEKIKKSISTSEELGLNSDKVASLTVEQVAETENTVSTSQNTITSLTNDLLSLNELVSQSSYKTASKDHEISMAKSQLMSILEKAELLNNMIEDDTELMSWVQAKLTKAADYLQVVRDYLKNRSPLEETKSANKDNEAVMARAQLMSIVDNSKSILELLEKETELMAWVQSKLTKAADYMIVITDYMQYRRQAKKKASRDNAKDLSLYDQAVREAKQKYEVWPSAYASGYVVKRYKELYKEKHGTGSPYRGKKPKAKLAKGLQTWFDEKWVDISRTNEDGSHPDCGRPGGNLTEKDFKKKYPKCVPQSKADEMSEKEKESAVRRKREKVREHQTPGKPVWVNTDPKR